MKLFAGIGQKHLDGHKDLTKDLPIIKIEDPQTIYIPLVDGIATDFDILVQEGDHVDIGTKLAVRKSMYVPLYSNISGTVKGIVKRMHASRRMQSHIAIENDFKYTSIPIFDTSSIPDNKEELIDYVKEAGLMGMGGAAFPTFIKYNNVKDIDTIIINGVECEPYITSDHVFMKQEAQSLIDGIRYMLKLSDAKKAIIAIKEHKKDLYDVLAQYVSQDIVIQEVPDVYPMGWERLLIETVTGKTYDRLPSEANVIVNNASTAIYLAKVLQTGLPVTRRIVTISGDAIKNPCNVDVLIGTPVQDILKQLHMDSEDTVHIISGGPMMGRSLPNDLFVIAQYMNAITIMKERQYDVVSCLRCGECTLHCPMHLQPVRIMNAEKIGDADQLMSLDVLKCIECGMCSYVCPSKIEVTEYISKGKRRANIRGGR